MAMSGAPGAQALDQATRIGARMAALHALEDQVVAVLQREVQVRHERAARRRTARTARRRPRSPSSEDRRRRVQLGKGVEDRARPARRGAGRPEDRGPSWSRRRRSARLRARPAPRCRSTSRSTSATGSERLGPRPCGITQKVQAWSQPFCTATKARVWRPAAAARRCSGTARCRPFQRGRQSSFGAQLPATSPSISGIAANCSRSISAAQPVTSSRASGRARARLADRLASLAHGLGGDRAAVDHHDVVASAQQRADALAFGDVEPAAERDHFRVQAKSPPVEVAAKAFGGRAGHGDTAILAPADQQRAAGQRDRDLALDQLAAHRRDRGGAGAGAAGAGQAGAALPHPQADFVRGSRPCATLTLTPSGNSGSVSIAGPSRCSGTLSQSRTKNTTCGLPTLTALGRSRSSHRPACRACPSRRQAGCLPFEARLAHVDRHAAVVGPHLEDAAGGLDPRGWP